MERKAYKKTFRVLFQILGEFPCGMKCTCQYNVKGICGDMESKKDEE